jgi:hypothetical protein
MPELNLYFSNTYHSNELTYVQKNKWLGYI